MSDTRKEYEMIYYMSKREGYLAASDVPGEGVILTIQKLYAVKDIPNRIIAVTDKYPDDHLIISKGDTKELITAFGTSESDEWIGRQIRVHITPRQFGGKKVWGMKVRAA